jgi:hypothetical protein
MKTNWYKNIKERYRVIERPNIREIEFFDIKIGPRSGRRNLVVKVNEYLPLEQLDENEFKNSLNNGCLRRAINANWVIIENGSNFSISNDYPIQKAITKEVSIEPGSTVVVEEKQQSISPIKEMQIERKSFGITESDLSKSNIDENKKKGRPKLKIDPNIEKEYNEFKKLSFDKRLEFIQNCNNIFLLEEIRKNLYKKEIRKACKERISNLKKEESYAKI